MIFINQIGQTELGRGETLEAAVKDAKSNGFEIDLDLPLYRPGWPVTDGSVVYCDEPLVGYNESGTLHNYATGEAIRPATADELAASRAAAERDGGSGVIVVDGVSCYVQE